MRKIPTALVREPVERKTVLLQINPGCEWVLGDPQVVARRKWDGTCVMLDEAGAWWARREVKDSKEPPPRWKFEDYDETTGKAQGWEPIEQSGFRKAFDTIVTGHQLADGSIQQAYTPGTYELVGPKINGNPEHVANHGLVRHETAEVLQGWPSTPHGLAAMVQAAGARGWEGLVFYGPDGQLAKLKHRDLISDFAEPSVKP